MTWKAFESELKRIAGVSVTYETDALRTFLIVRNG